MSIDRVEAARKVARRRGLRLIERGAVLTLRDGETVVHRGGVADTESYLAAQHPGRPPGGKPKPEFAVPPAWAQIIDDYVLSLAAAGQPATSLTLRRVQLVRMARDIGGSPTDVTADMLVGWFGSQTGWKTETRRNYRRGARLLAVGISHQTGARASGRRAAEGARAVECASARA